MSERTEQLNARLTELEAARVDRTVSAEGMDRAEWARETLLAAADVCPFCETPVTGRTPRASERTEQLHFRITEAEAAKITKAAARAGKSRAEWVRDSLLFATNWCPLCGSKLES